MSIKRITTEADLHEALKIRRGVFIEEQHVSEADEFDEFDTLQEQCQHILVYHENQPVGTGRAHRWPYSKAGKNLHPKTLP